MHRALLFITWNGVRYSVPAHCLGQTVEARVRVDSDELTIRWAGTVVATHRVATAGSADVWDPTHRHPAETAALASNRSRHLRVVTPHEEFESTPSPGRIKLGGDYDVAAPDLTLYERGQL